MAAAADPLSFSAPPPAASELIDYRWFSPCSVPDKSGATRAFKGFIRPFSDDETGRRVLRAIGANIPLQVSGGRLHVDVAGLQPHPLEEFLVDMAVPFSILLLEFEPPEHPRAFLFEPKMVPRLSASPHLRPDKSIEIDGVPYPALCVYSGNLYKYLDGQSRLEQFLDQTATYLAKYLIWLRTRRLYRWTATGPVLLRSPRPGAAITASGVSHSADLLWRGYWPGPSAPSGPEAHLATVSPKEECWCWSGKRYSECCRPRELKLVVERRREAACAELVRKLMTAVHARL